MESTDYIKRYLGGEGGAGAISWGNDTKGSGSTASSLANAQHAQQENEKLRKENRELKNQVKELNKTIETLRANLKHSREEAKRARQQQQQQQQSAGQS